MGQTESLLTDILGKDSLWIITGIGLFFTMFKHIRGFIDNIIKFFIIETQFPDKSRDFFCYAQKQKIFKCITLDREYGLYSFFNRKSKTYEYVPSKTVLTGRGLLIYKRTLVMYDIDTYEVVLRYLRGTFDAESFIKKISYVANNYRKRLNSVSPHTSPVSRYGVHIFRGKGSIHSRGFVEGISMLNNQNEDKDSNKEISPTAEKEDHTDPKLFVNQEFIVDDINIYGSGYVDGAKSFTNYVLTGQAKNFYDDIRCWYDSQSWYHQRGIPWKRGSLLVGEPGCGKTSLIKECAFDLNLPVCVFDLASMSNEDLHDKWFEAISQHTPCIMLIEDIDSVFDLRTNIVGVQGGGLTFDALLNTIGGVEEIDGVYIIATTNRLEHVDPALGVPDHNGHSSRPGRFDNTIIIEKPCRQARRQLAQQILEGTGVDVDQVAVDGDGDTMAQFKNRCVQLALSHYWDDKQSKPPTG